MVHLFTSESVGIGHPDKVCDAISDSILDACLSGDLESRVAVETLVTTQHVTIAGEVTSKSKVDYESVVRQTIKNIGYTNKRLGFDFEKAKVNVLIHSQSPDISQGVTKGKGLFTEQGAGDQGIMFGFATNETPSLMPLAIDLAHKIVRKAKDLRESGELPYLNPDCKSQVTVEYDGSRPKHIDCVVFSTHHTKAAELEQIRQDAIERVIKPCCGELFDESTRIFVNPTGRFIVGGPAGDTGVTGRKIIVDTYGGYARHGGGAFSGKDPSKVDRSAAYAARHIAKNIVAADLADKAEIQLSYAIGYSQPLSIFLETFGTEKADKEKIVKAVREVFDLSPSGIITSLKLKNPIYQATSFGGHFGREPKGRYFTWEKTDKVYDLKRAVSS